MSSEEEEECPECPAGLPAYLATFADLMSLLMCFFVLLLAFSEMDAQKYKRVAGSMSEAFGVQREIKANESPKGTSIIAQEFSPGRPEPTVLNEVRQKTVEDLANTLDVRCDPGESTEREEKERNESSEAAAKQQMEKIQKKLEAKTQADAVKAAAKLMNEIREGRIEIETRGREIVIRIKERGSFQSGSAKLRESFIPVMDKIRGAIESIKGVYAVSGHTDNVPIATLRFRSNWELSSARSVSVAHELLKTGTMSPELFTVVGHGETKPLLDNDTEENRSANRRVEIIINQGKDDGKYLSGEEELPDDDEFTEDLLRQAGLEGVEGFDILADELELSPETEDQAIVDGDEREISAFAPLPDDLLSTEEGPESESTQAELPPGDEFGESSEEIDVETITPDVDTPENSLPGQDAGDAFDISVDPFSIPSDAQDEEGEFF
ncbi:MAG: type VI secretion system protein TssL [Moraxellaceae bacterium]|nr:MAG: type VI secretion system protein TssL [Moraxellaceae bacterium]